MEKTEAELLADFYAWAQQQPDKRRFTYNSATDCPFACFLKEVYNPPYVGCASRYYRLIPSFMDEHPIPPRIANMLLNIATLHGNGINCISALAIKRRLAFWAVFDKLRACLSSLFRKRPPTSK